MNLDESFIFMISFFIFCFLVSRPVILHLKRVLIERISDIKNRILSAESAREVSFKDLKKAKRLLLSARKELEDNLKSFSSNVSESYRKNYADALVAFEKKYHHGLKFLQIQRDQEVLGLYENLLHESSNAAKKYILINRSKIPGDVEIAKELMKNLEL
jgi:F0F1-type ATP synthase membrane subunit b/b'